MCYQIYYGSLLSKMHSEEFSSLITHDITQAVLTHPIQKWAISTESRGPAGVPAYSSLIFSQPSVLTKINLQRWAFLIIVQHFPGSHMSRWKYLWLNVGMLEVHIFSCACCQALFYLLFLSCIIWHLHYYLFHNIMWPYLQVLLELWVFQHRESTQKTFHFKYWKKTYIPAWTTSQAPVNYNDAASCLIVFEPYSSVQCLPVALQYTIIIFSQISADQLALDAKYVFEMVNSDPEMESCSKNLKKEEIQTAVYEALEKLYDPSCFTQEEEISDVSLSASLVICVLQQWFIRYLCRSIMKLMTPEALIYHRMKIPSSYLEDYLVHQHHFNLKDLISSHIRLLQCEQGRR